MRESASSYRISCKRLHFRSSASDASLYIMRSVDFGALRSTGLRWRHRWWAWNEADERISKVMEPFEESVSGPRDRGRGKRSSTVLRKSLPRYRVEDGASASRRWWAGAESRVSLV